MKKTLFLSLILLICSAIPSQAQQKKVNKDRSKWNQEFRDFKLKFISQEIGLQENQKKRFNDLYAQMEKEKENVRKKTRQLEKTIKNNAKATDAQYEAVAIAITDAQINNAQIEKNYYTKFKSILTPKQMYLMKKAERKFTHRLMKMGKEKRRKK